MHLLLINPNTNGQLTSELVEQIRPYLSDINMPLMGATAPFGHPYIASEHNYVVAAHAVTEAWQAHVNTHGKPSAVLVACFGDPGVWALREIAQVPVIGLAEAAMREASAYGAFSIVTGGKAWGPMLERKAREWNLAGPNGLQHVHTVEANGAELAANPQAGAQALSMACTQLISSTGTQPKTIVLGGAALGGWSELLTPQPAIRLIDSVAAGARWLNAIRAVE